MKRFLAEFVGSVLVVLLLPYNLCLVFFIICSTLDKYVKQNLKAAKRHNAKIFR